MLLCCAVNTAVATTYYSISNTSPHLLASWNSNPAGGGTTPPNFSTSGDIFIVQGTGGGSGAPHTMTTSSTWTIGAGVTLEVQGGAVLQANSAITINATGNFILDNGATYNHNHTGAYASQILQGIENFDINSNFVILNSSSTGPGTPANGGFGNLIINSVNSSSVNCAGAMTDIKGNLTVIKTGNSGTIEFRLTGNTALTLNIGGDLDIQGGIFTMGNGTATPAINLSGDFKMSGGEFKNLATNNPNIQTLNFVKTGIQNFVKTAGIVTAATSSGRTIAFNVNSGSVLNMSTYILDNAAPSTATFTVASGGGLKLGSPAGISASGATGNVQVTGTRNFSTGATYEYNGSAAQVSGNGLPSSVAGLVINNPAGMTLSNASTTVTSQLNLSSGRIKTDITHSLIIATGATIASGINIYGDANEGTQTSFISGPLQIQTNSSLLKTFPIGKDTLSTSLFAPVKITPFNAVAKTYTAEYFPSSYDTNNVDAGQLHHVSKLETWEIQCSITGSPDCDAKVGLSWRPSSKLCLLPVCTVADSINAWTDLAIAHHYNDGFADQWHLDGGGLATYTMRAGSNLSYGYITTNVNVGSFSPFTLASKNNFNVLPLKLLSFSGNALASHVLLQWRTSEEKDVEMYQLQGSADGVNFSTIGTVYAYNTSGTNFYSYKYMKPFSGMNYYRLKVIDHSQKISYSNVVRLNLGKSQIALFPNPAVDRVTLLHEKATVEGTIRLFNTSGIEVMKVYAGTGAGQTSIDIHQLPKGVYYLIYTNEHSISLKEKFIKQ